MLLFGVLVLYNNYSFHRPTQAEFNAQLDHSIDTATNWIVQHPDIQGNPPLMFMIGDMADMSNDPTPAQLHRGVPGQPACPYAG